MPEDLGDTPAIGTLNYKPSPALRETQSGIDPTELPRILANAMPEGSWVAVTMRKPSNKERKFYTPWLGNRLGTAPWHTFDATAVLENSKLLGATPHWMRKGDHTAMIGSPMQRANVEAPHPAPAKPHLTKGRPLGAAIGNGGDAKLPRRLRIEW